MGWGEGEIGVGRAGDPGPLGRLSPLIVAGLVSQNEIGKRCRQQKMIPRENGALLKKLTLENMVFVFVLELGLFLFYIRLIRSGLN